MSFVVKRRFEYPAGGLVAAGRQALVRGVDVLGLRKAKKDRTRFQLLEAALDLIARQGFEQTTLNEIADAVQVSPRTLLRYFPAKEDVIVSWVDEGMTILRDGLEARPLGESRLDALLAAARGMLAAYQARGEFFLVIERTIAASPTVAARKQQMMEVLARDVSAILAEREGGQAQLPEPRSSLIRDVHVGTVFAIIRASIHSWVGTNGDRPLLDLFDEAACAVRFVEA